MANEEIDIDLNNRPLKNNGLEQRVDGLEEDVNQIRVAIGDISSMIRPGASNEELLDAILQTPDDKMIPWEECHLPSGGLYYGWPDGIVMVRAMGQNVEKVLANQRLAQSGQSIDYLINECCKFPDGFSAVDLLLGDKVFLLYFVRGITHGNNYEFAITCPNQECGALSTHSYDLNDLARTITWANRSLGQEPFKVSLPYMSKLVGKDFYIGVRFLRGTDANDMLAKRKVRNKLTKSGSVRSRRTPVDPRRQQQQSQQIDDSVTENLSKIIVSVMGIDDYFKIKQFVEKMHSQDTATVREWLRVNTPGIDNTVTVECPECSREITMELPITESFFRPSK